jgi:two-component system response regulator HupR/HoxA
VDVRVIAATHRQLEQRVRDGLFREDLYYRLTGISITVPPLRERVADIGPIAQQLVLDVAAELGHPGARLPDDTLACLLAYPWPGNIRELRNEIARALALHDGAALSPGAFSPRVLQGRAAGGGGDLMSAVPQTGTLGERLDVIEAMLLRETLLRHRWNKTKAAQELGLSRVGLRAKMQRFGLESK